MDATIVRKDSLKNLFINSYTTLIFVIFVGINMSFMIIISFSGKKKKHIVYDYPFFEEFDPGSG